MLLLAEVDVDDVEVLFLIFPEREPEETGTGIFDRLVFLLFNLVLRGSPCRSRGVGAP